MCRTDRTGAVRARGALVAVIAAIVAAVSPADPAPARWSIVVATAATPSAASLTSPADPAATPGCVAPGLVEVTVEWSTTSPGLPVTYRVERRLLSPVGPAVEIGTTTTTTFTDSSALLNALYEYAVVAELGGWASPATAPIPVTTPALCI